MGLFIRDIMLVRKSFLMARLESLSFLMWSISMSVIDLQTEQGVLNVACANFYILLYELRSAIGEIRLSQINFRKEGL